MVLPTPRVLFRLLKTIISPHAPYFALFVFIVFIG